MDHSDQMQDIKRTEKKKTAFRHTLRWCPARKLRDNLKGYASGFWVRCHCSRRAP